jgi:flagellar protein FlaG
MSTEIVTRYVQAVTPPGDGFRASVVQAVTPQPAQASKAKPQAEQDGPSSVEEAVRELSDHAQAAKTELRFQVNEDVGRVIVSIVDAKSGEVLMQIPGEEALRIAKMLRHKDHHGFIEAVA